MSSNIYTPPQPTFLYFNSNRTKYHLIHTHTPNPSKSRIFMDTRHVQIYIVETGAIPTPCLVVSLPGSAVPTLVLAPFCHRWRDIAYSHQSPNSQQNNCCHWKLTVSVKFATISKLLSTTFKATHSLPFFPYLTPQTSLLTAHPNIIHMESFSNP